MVGTGDEGCQERAIAVALAEIQGLMCSLHLDFHDIDAVILLVAYGVRVMPQEAEGYLFPSQDFGLLAEVGQPIFQVLLLQDCHEFHLHHPAVGTSDNNQAGRVFGVVVVTELQQAR